MGRSRQRRRTSAATLHHRPVALAESNRGGGDRPADVQAELADLQRRFEAASTQADYDQEALREAFAELTLAAEDIGWRRMVAAGDIEFDRAGLGRIAEICRIMAVKSPLIKRGLSIRQTYVWGQGVEVSGRAAGKSGEQDVNAVIQQFFNDPANRRTFTGHQARLAAEHCLGTDGNLPILLFTKPSTGRVQARTVPFEQVIEVIPNPDDASDPWYFRRQWSEMTLDTKSGTVIPTPKQALHPAIGYRPASRPPTMGSVPVMWDAPMVLVKVNAISTAAQFGIPDAYAAVDWARAYKLFLEDWARLCRALSRIAWKATTPGRASSKVAAAIAKAPTVDPLTREPREAGATAVVPPTVNLEAVNKTGATLDSESGRPLAAMVAAGLDVPVTMLLGDPGVTGARATAETLDRPTEMAMSSRRELWTDVLLEICEYLVRESVRAQKGALKGKLVVDEWGKERVELDGDTDATVDVTWPPIEEADPLTMVQAIVAADDTGKVPAKVILTLLLQALNVRHVDEIVDEMVDDDGNWIGPDPQAAAGQAAADALRNGQDPAPLLGGKPPAPPDPATSGGTGGGGDAGPEPTADDETTVPAGAS